MIALVMNMAIKVPGIANIMMDPIFWKNSLIFNLRALSNIIGGSRIIRKI